MQDKPMNLHNRHVKDNGAKLLFGDATMCAQFLNDYIPLDMVKNIPPENISDISERFLPIWDEGRDSDTVKKIRLADNSELIFLALIEHQSEVDYDVSMKLLRYMVFIWTDYAREQEALRKGCTKRKDFQYPPILPIVYYEGVEEWTATLQFADRIQLNELLKEYIPNFSYQMVRLHSYSDEEIVSHGNELSLVMLINKMTKTKDFKKLQEIPREYLKNLEEQSPDHLLRLISLIIKAFLVHINVPRDEIEKITEPLERRKLSMMFDSFEAYDVQQVRADTRKETEERMQKETDRKVGEARLDMQQKERREMLLETLEDYGEISDGMRNFIMSQTDVNQLKEWCRIARHVSSVKEFAEKTKSQE